ncbi:hypothetical protein TWF696_009927 [Orbilia brochopaga]|uniref:Uncharacterized protein n=1 Tax=Orbilia brochopaga TaxID=3140254 RepID=A0AAV9V3W3_9PEZI
MFDHPDDRGNTLVKRLFGKSRRSFFRKSSNATSGPSNSHNSFDRSSRGSFAGMSDQEQRRESMPSPTNIGRVTSTQMSSTESQRETFTMPPPQPQPPKRPIGEKIVRWLKYGPVD